jgi:hypothetical protein
MALSDFAQAAAAAAAALACGETTKAALFNAAVLVGATAEALDVVDPAAPAVVVVENRPPMLTVRITAAGNR